jgi:steroid delta-isomerase-like uncharacterized protein
MSNQPALRQAIECFGDPARRPEYFHLYSDDVVLHGYQGVEPGLESVKQFYNAFWQAFPDARVRVDEIIEAGEALAVRYVITGSLQETFMGVPAAGQPIELMGISTMHFRDGRCFERWASLDGLVLLEQIGAASARTS